MLNNEKTIQIIYNINRGNHNHSRSGAALGVSILSKLHVSVNGSLPLCETL